MLCAWGIAAALLFDSVTALRIMLITWIMIAACIGYILEDWRRWYFVCKEELKKERKENKK